MLCKCVSYLRPGQIDGGCVSKLRSVRDEAILFWLVVAVPRHSLPWDFQGCIPLYE